MTSRSVAVLSIGARKHELQPGTQFRVYLDPEDHPFCSSFRGGRELPHAPPEGNSLMSMDSTRSSSL